MTNSIDSNVQKSWYDITKKYALTGALALGLSLGLSYEAEARNNHSFRLTKDGRISYNLNNGQTNTNFFYDPVSNTFGVNGRHKEYKTEELPNGKTRKILKNTYTGRIDQPIRKDLLPGSALKSLRRYYQKLIQDYIRENKIKMRSLVNPYNQGTQKIEDTILNFDFDKDGKSDFEGRFKHILESNGKYIPERRLNDYQNELNQFLVNLQNEFSKYMANKLK